MARKTSSYDWKYSSSLVVAWSPKAAFDQIHSPTSVGQTSARVSLMRQPTCAPKYIYKEKGWAGIPARSSVGLSSASWKEGKRADNEGILTRQKGFILAYNKMP